MARQGPLRTRPGGGGLRVPADGVRRGPRVPGQDPGRPPRRPPGGPAPRQGGAIPLWTEPRCRFPRGTAGDQGPAMARACVASQHRIKGPGPESWTTPDQHSVPGYLPSHKRWGLRGRGHSSEVKIATPLRFVAMWFDHITFLKEPRFFRTSLWHCTVHLRPFPALCCLPIRCSGPSTR